MILEEIKLQTDSLNQLKAINYSRLNALSLKNMLSYLHSLKNNDLIDDSDYIALVNFAAEIFIENEANRRITKAIDDRLSSYLFPKLLKNL